MQRWFGHPVFAWAGLRPVQAQHTEAEHNALSKYARGKRNVVELGVAEGASAVALREAMDDRGTLHLIDPYHLSRLPMLNFLRRAARKAVNGFDGAKVVWHEQFSYQAAADWKGPIDFLFLDGDHQENAVEQDWNQWSPFLAKDAVVVFHDARVFPDGWTEKDNGPVRFVDRKFRNNRESPWSILDEVDSLVFVARR